jgi:hypothetical protein
VVEYLPSKHETFSSNPSTAKKKKKKKHRMKQRKIKKKLKKNSTIKTRTWNREDGGSRPAWARPHLTTSPDYFVPH